jgi:hypothetical protein
VLNALAEEVACRGEFSEGALVSGDGLVTFHHVVEQQGGRSKPAPTRRGSWASSAGLLGDIPPRDTDNRELIFERKRLFAKRRVNPPKSR